MSWDRIELDVAAAGEGLAARIEGLFAQQRATWPTLREGEAALQHLQVKRLEVDGASIVVQANPARRNSVHASVDAQSIAARACFLCPENMPPEERGVAFEDLLVLPNPYPILPMHCTVADRAHRQQRLAGRVEQLVRLAAAAGPELAVFYNGPRSGASAPDHLHFQACRAAGIPLLEELSGAAADSRGVLLESVGRSVLLFAGAELGAVAAGVERALAGLAAAGATPDVDAEPMVNVLAQAAGGGVRVLLFPRRVHRPACYFAAEPSRIAVSPATLEMAGILVAADVEHLARIDEAAVRAIYREVSWDADALRPLVGR